MPRVAAVLLLALLLGGCLGGGESPPARVTLPPTSPSTSDDSGVARGDENATLRAARAVPVSFEGRYPTAAYVCHQAIQCKGAETGPYANDARVKDLTGTITRVHLTMTWQASAPTMQTLGLAIMTMYPRDCAACPKSAEFAEARGPSPLKLDKDDLAVPIDPRGVLHVYFYPLNAADAPVAVEADAETRVRVDGAATLAAPPAPG